MKSIRNRLNFVAIGLVAAVVVTGSAMGQAGTLVAWGQNNELQLNVPIGLKDVVSTAHMYHNVALKSDGTIVCWGRNTQGQCNIPNNLPIIAEVSTGVFHTIVRTTTGSLFAWGGNYGGVLNIPANLDPVKSIAAAGYSNIALFENGTVTCWGDNGAGQSTTPTGLVNVIQIAGSDIHAGALKSDGTVVCWGATSGPFNYGQSNVPVGLQNVTQLSMGCYHTAALKSDGSITYWGQNNYGECTTPDNRTDFSKVAAGNFTTMGLTHSGLVLCWGNNTYKQNEVPSMTGTVDFISAGGDSCVVILNQASITYVQPISGPSTGGTAVRINGNNFPVSPIVTFGGVSATDIVRVSPSLITAVTPAGFPGPAVVTVNLGSSTAFYYRPSCGSDVDNNGVVDSADLGIVLGDFGNCYESLATPQEQEPLIFQTFETPSPLLLNKK